MGLELSVAGKVAAGSDAGCEAPTDPINDKHTKYLAGCQRVRESLLTTHSEPSQVASSIDVSHDDPSACATTHRH